MCEERKRHEGKEGDRGWIDRVSVGGKEGGEIRRQGRWKHLSMHRIITKSSIYMYNVYILAAASHEILVIHQTG